MTLKDWLAAREMTIPEFAAAIGRTAETVRRYTTGDRIPDKETMPLIAQHTAGVVTANDFFGITPALAFDAAPLLCDACELRLDDPVTGSCTRGDCPGRQRAAA